VGERMRSLRWAECSQQRRNYLRTGSERAASIDEARTDAWLAICRTANIEAAAEESRRHCISAPFSYLLGSIKFAYSGTKWLTSQSVIGTRS
jgi:hypothetical protein